MSEQASNPALDATQDLTRQVRTYREQHGMYAGRERDVRDGTVVVTPAEAGRLYGHPTGTHQAAPTLPNASQLAAMEARLKADRVANAQPMPASRERRPNGVRRLALAAAAGVVVVGAAVGTLLTFGGHNAAAPAPKAIASTEFSSPASPSVEASSASASASASVSASASPSPKQTSASPSPKAVESSAAAFPSQPATPTTKPAAPPTTPAPTHSSAVEVTCTADGSIVEADGQTHDEVFDCSGDVPMQPGGGEAGFTSDSSIVGVNCGDTFPMDGSTAYGAASIENGAESSSRNYILLSQVAIPACTVQP